jgi:hypothetical protein
MLFVFHVAKSEAKGLRQAISKLPSVFVYPRTHAFERIRSR